MAQESTATPDASVPRKIPGLVAVDLSKARVGFGVILPIMTYLVLLALFLILGLVASWSAAAGNGARIHLVLFSIPLRSEELRIILIVLFSGALGGQIHALKSFYWYVGNRALVLSWMAMYLLLPLVGGILGLIFYLVIRGGFFATQTISPQSGVLSFAAVAALVGLFSEQALMKLKELATTLFSEAEKGKDASPERAEDGTPETRG